MAAGFLMFSCSPVGEQANRIRSVLHGALIGLTGALLFTALVFVLSGSLARHPLYWVAPGLKIVGGITGGIVANRRSMNRRTLVRT
jgi:hypothetical protein